MALFQQHKAGVTPNEACSTSDEHAPAHVFNRADLLILDQFDGVSLTSQVIKPSVRSLRWICG